MLKRILLFVLFTAIGLFTSLTPVQAATSKNIDITRVRGQILGPDNQPLKHAQVTVLCHGKTKKDKTNANGKYLVLFTGKNTCEAGDTVEVTVEKEGMTGQGTGIVLLKRDGKVVDINFSVINVSINVPEFGLLTGAFAALTSAGGYLALKKKV